MDEAHGAERRAHPTATAHIVAPAETTDDSTDPDPFTIALGIFAAIAGGGSFLEARRQRQFM